MPFGRKAEALAEATGQRNLVIFQGVPLID